MICLIMQLIEYIILLAISVFSLTKMLWYAIYSDWNSCAIWLTLFLVCSIKKHLLDKESEEGKKEGV